jgi:anti-anti-sigma factor
MAAEKGTLRAHVAIERRDGYIAVRSQGELDVAAVGELQRALRRVTSPKHGLVLDLRHAAGMNVAHLRALLEASEESRRQGWAVLLFPPRAGPV